MGNLCMDCKYYSIKTNEEPCSNCSHISDGYNAVDKFESKYAKENNREKLINYLLKFIEDITTSYNLSYDELKSISEVSKITRKLMLDENNKPTKEDKIGVNLDIANDEIDKLHMDVYNLQCEVNELNSDLNKVRCLNEAKKNEIDELKDNLERVEHLNLVKNNEIYKLKDDLDRIKKACEE